MTFPLMPLPTFNLGVGELTALSTADTNDIEVGDFLLIFQYKFDSSITTPSGATSLISGNYLIRFVRGSIKIATLADIGAVWDSFERVVILRHSSGSPLAFSSDVGSGTVSTVGYGAPLGAMNMVWRDSGDNASSGTIDGSGVDIGYSGGDAAVELEGGVWIGDFNENPSVSIVNGKSEGGSHRWRFVYKA